MAKKKVTKQIPKKSVKKPVKAPARKVPKPAAKKAAKPATKKPVKASPKKKAAPAKKTAKTIIKKAAGAAAKKSSSQPVKKSAPAKKAISKPAAKKADTKKITTHAAVKQNKPAATIRIKNNTNIKSKSSDSKKSTTMDKKMVKPAERKPVKVAEKETVKISEKRAAISRDSRISNAELVKKDPRPGKKESLLATLEIKKPVKLFFPEVKPGHEFTIEEKLRALYQLQYIDSQIDKIRIVRGELPMEVSDLEDEVAGLQTRITNYTQEAAAISEQISNKKLSIKDSQGLIKKYESQQMNVKNNREYDSLTKENEFQKLEIQLAEKRIKEHMAELAAKTSILEASQQTLDERMGDLQNKKNELDNIVAETQKEEEDLQKMSKQAEAIIEERLLSAYKNIRENAVNGLAVVTISRDACGGCFNKIPPQRQLDIRQHKKVIVCEHCGRILVDASFAE
jgi:predicted  nucleic acid-binding Zn-ribbon protein